jgi:hypothetical protein
MADPMLETLSVELVQPIVDRLPALTVPLSIGATM